jgi:hypothetical protein
VERTGKRVEQSLGDEFAIKWRRAGEVGPPCLPRQILGWSDLRREQQWATLSCIGWSMWSVHSSYVCSLSESVTTESTRSVDRRRTEQCWVAGIVTRWDAEDVSRTQNQLQWTVGYDAKSYEVGSRHGCRVTTWRSWSSGLRAVTTFRGGLRLCGDGLTISGCDLTTPVIEGWFLESVLSTEVADIELRLDPLRHHLSPELFQRGISPIRSWHDGHSARNTPSYPDTQDLHFAGRLYTNPKILI